MPRLLIHPTYSGNEAINKELAGWAAENEGAIVAVLLVAAAAVIIHLLSTRERRTAARHFISAMVHEWPALIGEVRRSAAAHAGKIFVIGLIVMVALVMLAFAPRVGAADRALPVVAHHTQLDWRQECKRVQALQSSRRDGADDAN